MQFSPEILKQKLNKPLPGIVSHLKMAPATRVSEIVKQNVNFDKAMKSAVLILLYHERNSIKVVFIRRSFYVGIHAGQIAFPGGRYEESDIIVENTALREIEEEIGIQADKIDILGRLSDIFVPPSNFLISVFVGYLNEKPTYNIDVREVAEVIEIDFKELENQTVFEEKEFYVASSDTTTKAPFYKAGNVQIWGATAMVVSELIDILSD